MSKKKDWRTYHKGDLVYVWGFGVDGFQYIPAFVYESQRQKDIVQIYAFGQFDEHSSAYLKNTYKAEDVTGWLKSCGKQGHDADKVEKAMEDFSISTKTIGKIKNKKSYVR